MFRLLRQSLTGNTLVYLTVFALFLTLWASVAPASAATAADAENVTVYRATDSDFDGTDGIEAAIENGTVSPAERIVLGDTLVVGIGSERLADALDDGDGSTTKRFFDALDGDAEFRIVQTNMDTHSPPKVVPVSAENVTVYRQGTTTYALVDTDAVEFKEYYRDRDEYEPAELRDGDAFAAEFGYDLGEVPFHGASRYDPAGPEFRLHTSESEASRQRSAIETPSETATSTETVATPTMSGSTETSDPVTTTDSEGAGFTPVAALVALLLPSPFLTRAIRDM